MMPTPIKEGSRIGPYRVTKVFSQHRGGFAQVAMGVRDDAGKGATTVALKIAHSSDKRGDDSYTRALSNEVETLRRLKHPGIVRIYPIKVDDRRYSFMARAAEAPGQPWYFVLEYLSGESVEELIDQRGMLEPNLAAELAQQICMALDYMHARGYAHLDIKPNNVILRRPFTPGQPLEAVLIDFGSAQKSARRAEVEAGALAYLPPERVQVMLGEKPPEHVTDKAAVDMYAVGVTLYRMLTGQLPFSGRRSHVTTAILNETPTRPMQFNEGLRHFRELEELVMQMLDKRPERRPSAQEVATRLDQIVPPPRLEIHQKVIAPPRPPQRSGGKGWRTAAILLVVLLLIETGILAMNWPLNLIPGVSAESTIVQPAPTLVPAATIAPAQPATSVPATLPPKATATAISGGGVATSTPTPQS